MKRTALLVAAVLTTLATPAMAHTGTGIAVGFLHPLLGWDHLIAMIAVGAWAALLGGRAIWAVPSAFVAAMIAGGLAGMSGVNLPFAELAILASVFVLAALVLFRIRISTPAAMAVAAGFALAHGHAHGAEVPALANATSYVLGFVLATSLLHLIGVVATSFALRTRQESAT